MQTAQAESIFSAVPLLLKDNPMYRFIKIKDNYTGLEYPYMLECYDIVQLIEHTDKYLGTTIELGVIDFFRCKNHHAVTDWRGAVETLARAKGTTFMKESCILENKIYAGKVKSIINYGCILLRESGSYMVLPTDYEIIDTLENEKLIYPSDKKDIRYLQWTEGGHYYAKVGSVDVVDSSGNQKWNTKQEAEEAVKEYFQNLL